MTARSRITLTLDELLIVADALAEYRDVDFLSDDEDTAIGRVAQTIEDAIDRCTVHQPPKAKGKGKVKVTPRPLFRTPEQIARQFAADIANAERLAREHPPQRALPRPR